VTTCNAACDAGNGCDTGCTPLSPDSDGDGVNDLLDNCPAVPNAGQGDLDGDGLGDACDPQTCGNGAVEGSEACDGGSCCSAQCTVAANGTACSDADPCTSADQCQSGICVGGNPVVCSASGQCHAAGTCNPSTGVCSNPARPDGTTCSDGNACSTGDVCTGGACAGSPMNCDDRNVCTTDACAAGACTHTDNTVSCNDGNACTSGDACAGGQCGGGAAVDCDDHNACTADSCVTATGCARTPVAGCACQAAACGPCRDQCAPSNATCTANCWTSFLQCLDGCGNQTYCAPFCQVDLGQCSGACQTVAVCESACDASHGCGNACTTFGPPGDIDGDGVTDDLDNCVNDSNPTQSDLDGDSSGDECDVTDAVLASAQATVRAGNAVLSNGRVKLRGTFEAAAPADTFDATAGVGVTVVCGNGTIAFATWSGADCVLRGEGRINCAAPDRSSKGSFRAGAAGTWKYRVTLSGLAMASPAIPPVTVRLRHGSAPTDRTGNLTVCTPPGSAIICSAP
jgi:hypothetical protein